MHIFDFVRISRVASLWSCLNFRIRISLTLFKYQKSHLIHFVWNPQLVTFSFRCDLRGCTTCILFQFQRQHIFHLVRLSKDGTSFILFEFQKLHPLHFVRISVYVSLSFSLSFRSCISYILFEFHNLGTFYLVPISQLHLCHYIFISDVESLLFWVNFWSFISLGLSQFQT